MDFFWLSDETTIVSVNITKQLICITEDCVFLEVRNQLLRIIEMIYVLRSAERDVIEFLQNCVREIF